MTPAMTAIKNPSASAGSFAAFQAFQNQSFRKLGFTAVLAYLVLKFGMVHEFIAFKLGIDTHMVVLVTAAAFLATLVSGAMGRIVRSKILIAMMLFSIWLVVGVPFSSWIGGSIGYVLNFYWRTIVPIFIAIAVLPSGIENIRKMGIAIGCGAVVASLIGKVFAAATAGGRMEMEFGSIKNSGDFAAFYVVSMPFLFFLFQNSRNWLVKATLMGLFVSNVILVLSTAARSSLVAFAVALVFVLIWGSNLLRVFVLGFAIVLYLMASVVLPSGVLDRLSSLTGAVSEETLEAEGSRLARQAVAERALKYTFQHPVFGVGVGVFPDYDAKITLSGGARRAQWQETHNGYLQVSVEAGLPALLFKMIAVFWAFNFLRKTYRRCRKDPRLKTPAALSLTIMASLAMTMVFELFLSQGYAFWMMTMVAMTGALQMAMLEDPAMLEAMRPNRSAVNGSGNWAAAPLAAGKGRSMQGAIPVESPVTVATAKPFRFGGRQRSAG